MVVCLLTKFIPVPQYLHPGRESPANVRCKQIPESVNRANLGYSSDPLKITRKRSANIVHVSKNFDTFQRARQNTTFFTYEPSYLVETIPRPASPRSNQPIDRMVEPPVVSWYTLRDPREYSIKEIA